MLLHPSLTGNLEPKQWQICSMTGNAGPNGQSHPIQSDSEPTTHDGQQSGTVEGAINHDKHYGGCIKDAFNQS